MKWLVTVDEQAELGAVCERLRARGCREVDADTAVELSGDEIVIAVDGPRDLPKLVGNDDAITGVFENSDIVLT